MSCKKTFFQKKKSPLCFFPWGQSFNLIDKFYILEYVYLRCLYPFEKK
jgi:hypothetical protein